MLLCRTLRYIGNSVYGHPSITVTPAQSQIISPSKKDEDVNSGNTITSHDYNRELPLYLHSVHVDNQKLFTMMCLKFVVIFRLTTRWGNVLWATLLLILLCIDKKREFSLFFIIILYTQPRSNEFNSDTRHRVSSQFPRQLHGGRAGRRDARVSPLGRSHHRAAR